MTEITALPDDELLLAQLTTAKLSRIVHGLISVGVPALELDAPEEFLSGKDELLLAFIEVLRSLSLRPGPHGRSDAFRKQTRQLRVQALQFHREFLAFAKWRTLSLEQIPFAAQRLGDSYRQFGQSLDDTLVLLGAACPSLARLQEGTQLLDGFVRVLLQREPLSAATPRAGA